MKYKSVKKAKRFDKTKNSSWSKKKGYIIHRKEEKIKQVPVKDKIFIEEKLFSR
jgi:hypothetical protein